MKILKLIGNKIANAFYSLPRVLFINFYRSFLRIRITNQKKIPNGHAVIFAFNHTTGADPIIALGALRRKIHFLADSGRFTNSFTAFFMRKFANSTPVFQKEARKNIKSFKELLLISSNKKVSFGIFPEGDLFKKGKFGKFHDGAAYLSFKTKIPIVPVYMHNVSLGPTNESWVGRHPVFEGIASLFMNTYRRIHVFIGDPIDPIAENIMEELSDLTDKNEYKKIIDKITEELKKEFLELKEEADILSISGKSALPAESLLAGKPARVQKSGILITDNSKTNNMKTKSAITGNSITGQLKTSPGCEDININDFMDFGEDEELIAGPAAAK
jgi:1-acyl-sn-glycerol-3-phosphate acyltransferase